MINFTIHRDLSKLFLSLGIMPNIKGFDCLISAVELSIENPALLGRITGGLYPAVADACNTTPKRAERAMRHAISIVWEKGRAADLQKLLGVTCSFNAKPSPGEFVAMLADYFIQREKSIAHGTPRSD